MSEERELPGSWRWATVGEICEADNGRAFKSSEWRDSGVPIIRIENLKKANAKFNYFQGDLDDKHRVQDGDLLFAWSGTPGTSFGAHIWKGPDSALNQHIFNIRFDRELIEDQYFKWALNENVRSYVRQAQGGVGLAHITKKKFMASQIPLAPREEQRRMIETLDSYLSRLDAAVAGVEHAQANLKRYRASVLQSAVEGRLVPTEAELAREEGRDYEPAEVLLARILTERRHRWEEAELKRLEAKGKPPTNDKWRSKYKEPAAPLVEDLPELPEGWCWTTAEALSDQERAITYGVIKLGKEISEGVPTLRSSNVRHLFLDTKFVKSIDRSISDNYGRTILKGGEVLVTVRGTLGGVCLVPESCSGSNVSREVAMIAPVIPAVMSIVTYFIGSPMLQGWLTRRTRGIAYQGVNIGTLKELPVPLPPMEEQSRISAEVAKHLSVVDGISTDIRGGVRKSDALRKSILSWAFDGRLVGQDPCDEPASSLLARIAERSVQSGQQISSARRLK